MVFFRFMMNILNFSVKIILIYSQDILKDVPNLSCLETKDATKQQWRATRENVYIDNLYKKYHPHIKQNKF